MGAGEGGTLPARGSQIGRGEGGWLLTLPPPRSLEEPRITPGGPPSPTLPELRWGPFYGLQRGSQAVQLSLHLEIKMSSTSLALKRTHFPQLSNITHIVTQTQRVRVEGANVSVLQLHWRGSRCKLLVVLVLPDELERRLARHVLFVAIHVLDVVPRLVILLDSANAPAGSGEVLLDLLADDVVTSKLGKLIKEYSTLPRPGGVPQLRGGAGGPGGGRPSTLPPA